MTASGTYPTREPFFANRFVRLLANLEVAGDLGADVCWMLTVVAHKEDEFRYAKPVNFYNDQIKKLCGFGTKRRLLRARNAAVDSGWLHYQKRHRNAGVYWAKIPANVAHLEGVATAPQETSPSALGCRNSTPTSTSSSTLNVDLGCRNSTPSIPIPSPIPIEDATASESVSEKRKNSKADGTKAETKLILSWYLAWFRVYPSEGGELGGRRSFPKAIRGIAKKRSLDIEAARDWLMETTRTFATSERGSGQYCPYANRFLAESEFDKPSLWSPSQSGNSSAPSEYKTLKIHRRVD